jgi:opacity protein-like surface antigen
MEDLVKKNFMVFVLLFVSLSVFAQSRKTTTNQNIFSLSFSEHNDGCLVRYESGYYHYRTGSYSAIEGGGSTQIRRPEHRNDNAFVRAEINRFNNEIKKLNAVPFDNHQATLNSTPIGSSYFVYRIGQEYGQYNYISSVDEGIPRSEIFVIYYYNIWRVNVVAGNRSTTGGSNNSSTNRNVPDYDFNQHESHYLLLGYNYAYGLPGGFTFGVSPYIDGLLLYTSWNFGKNNISNSMFEWTFGGYIPIIKKHLMIPIGIGGNHSHIGFDDLEEKKIWEHAFTMEIGLQYVIFNNFYLSSTYRLIGFSKNSFTIGAGIIF